MIVCEVDVGIDIVAELVPSLCFLVGLKCSDRDMKLDTAVLREETWVNTNLGRNRGCAFYDKRGVVIAIVLSHKTCTLHIEAKISPQCGSSVPRRIPVSP